MTTETKPGKMPADRARDEASIAIIEKAGRDCVDTCFNRMDTQANQCAFGRKGLCCRICHMGPCRITPKSPRGVCGADADTVPGEGDPWLSLGGLKTISSGVAGVLAMHHGPLLLDGLAELSPEVARALATHSGELSLAGLTSLSDDARAALAAHDGPVVLPDALLTTASGG